jgi:uncharacterized membrane protein
VTVPGIPPVDGADGEPHQDSQLTGIEQFQALIQRQQHFTGPLPPPDLLAGYEQVLPGAAERIFAMAEGQAKHRQALERTVVVGGHRRSWAGLIVGGIVAFAFLIAAYRLIQAGHSLAGTFLGTVDLTGLVAVFVLGRASQRRDASTEGGAET